MNIDSAIFDDVYSILAKDIVNKLLKIFPHYKIEIKNKNLKLEDIVILKINDITYEFDLNEYIDKSILLNEKVVFDDLADKIKNLF